MFWNLLFTTVAGIEVVTGRDVENEYIITIARKYGKKIKVLRSVRCSSINDIAPVVSNGVPVSLVISGCAVIFRTGHKERSMPAFDPADVAIHHYSSAGEEVTAYIRSNMLSEIKEQLTAAGCNICNAGLSPVSLIPVATVIRQDDEAHAGEYFFRFSSSGLTAVNKCAHVSAISLGGFSVEGWSVGSFSAAVNFFAVDVPVMEHPGSEEYKLRQREATAKSKLMRLIVLWLMIIAITMVILSFASSRLDGSIKVERAASEAIARSMILTDSLRAATPRFPASRLIDDIGQAIPKNVELTTLQYFSGAEKDSFLVQAKCSGLSLADSTMRYLEKQKLRKLRLADFSTTVKGSYFTISGYR